MPYVEDRTGNEVGFFEASLRFGSSESHWASWSCKLARCPPPEECRRTRRCDLSAKGIYSLTLLPHGHICGPHCRPHPTPPPFLCRSPGGGDAPRDFRLLSSPSVPVCTVICKPAPGYPAPRLMPGKPHHEAHAAFWSG